ncbi:FecR domain-containing protein [Pseudomonas sp. B21-054]|uniref:FecR family protein n=1 Tax=Pseudomonas sp. B21-054 TaxID=2895494 RepID=UPI002232440E|nr:FecR domain-containing protein [Pseudomonas sp. B21-054]UZE20233.1 FecR domain-containing protein [Pseudomonas sp. B21-054]
MSHPSLLDQARQWQVLLHSGRATAADRAAAQAWRQAAPEHEQALREVEGLWSLLGQIERPAEQPQVRALRRRRWAAPLACAAMLLLALWLPRGIWIGLYADISTQPGEVRELRLADGSLLTLNGDSALDWQFVDGRREVRLYRGEADFQIAHDPARPFIVRAGEAHIRVTGTRFDVRLEEGGVDLAVSEGRVLASSEGREPLPVVGGQQVQWRGGELQAPQALDARQRLGWQRGKLVFRDQPLEHVFAELERSQSARVLFVDEAARAVQVTGVFALNDPEAVLRAVETTLPVSLVRLPGLILVTSRR